MQRGWSFNSLNKNLNKSARGKVQPALSNDCLREQYKLSNNLQMNLCQSYFKNKNLTMVRHAYHDAAG